MNHYIQLAAFSATLAAILYIVIFINEKSFSSVIAGVLMLFAFLLVLVSNILSIKKIRNE